MIYYELRPLPQIQPAIRITAESIEIQRNVSVTSPMECISTHDHPPCHTATSPILEQILAHLQRQPVPPIYHVPVQLSQFALASMMDS